MARKPVKASKGEISLKRPTKRVIFVLCLTASYMVAEAIGGFYSKSLSLLADAGHMLADVAALSTALVAFAIAAKPPDHQATYGYYRAEILAALFNGLVLLLMAFFIVKSAISRFFHPEEVESLLMIPIAIGGLLINLIGLFLLHKEREENLNVRGAWLHLFSDTLGSVGAVISGFLIYFLDLYLADAITSIIIAILVSISAIHLIFETLWVLMEHSPAHIDGREVRRVILAIPGALKVHHLHIWSIAKGHEALSVHVVAADNVNFNNLLKEIKQTIETRFAIHHTTIQIESSEKSL